MEHRLLIKLGLLCAFSLVGCKQPVAESSHDTVAVVTPIAVEVSSAKLAGEGSPVLKMAVLFKNNSNRSDVKIFNAQCSSIHTFYGQVELVDVKGIRVPCRMMPETRVPSLDDWCSLVPGGVAGGTLYCEVSTDQFTPPLTAQLIVWKQEALYNLLKSEGGTGFPQDRVAIAKAAGEPWLFSNSVSVAR